MSVAPDDVVTQVLELDNATYRERTLALKAWRAAEAFHNIRVLNKISLGPSIDLDGSCKFQNRGAPCVSHCGDPFCLPKTTKPDPGSKDNDEQRTSNQAPC